MRAAEIKNNFSNTMHDAQKAMLKHALAIAQHNHTELSLNRPSVGQLDALLERIAVEMEQEGLKTEEQLAHHDGVKGICESLGAYIAECAEHRLGKGEWSDTNPEGGEPALALTLRTGTTIFPMDWVLKKLLDPKGYSIAEVFEAYVSPER